MRFGGKCPKAVRNVILRQRQEDGSILVVHGVRFHRQIKKEWNWEGCTVDKEATGKLRNDDDKEKKQKNLTAT